jgi:hypothetical protein
VDKKFISLLTSSILKVYNGVIDVWGLAVTQVAARDTAIMLATAIDTFCFPFIFITSFFSIGQYIQNLLSLVSSH